MTQFNFCKYSLVSITSLNNACLEKKYGSESKFDPLSNIPWFEMNLYSLFVISALLNIVINFWSYFDKTRPLRSSSSRPVTSATGLGALFLLP